MSVTADVRFIVPLYTCTEAAGYLGVPPTTFATWLKGYARGLELPRYEVAHIVTDPEVDFGKPYFAHGGTPLAVVRDLLRAGETLADVANDFGIPIDEVAEFAQRERLLTA